MIARFETLRYAFQKIFYLAVKEYVKIGASRTKSKVRVQGSFKCEFCYKSVGLLFINANAFTFKHNFVLLLMFNYWIFLFIY